MPSVFTYDPEGPLLPGQSVDVSVEFDPGDGVADATPLYLLHFSSLDTQTWAGPLIGAAFIRNYGTLETPDDIPRGEAFTPFVSTDETVGGLVGDPGADIVVASLTAGVLVNSVNAATSATFTWTAATYVLGGVATYQLQRSIAQFADNWLTLASGDNILTLADSSRVAGAEYKYRVRISDDTMTVNTNTVTPALPDLTGHTIVGFIGGVGDSIVYGTDTSGPVGGITGASLFGQICDQAYAAGLITLTDKRINSAWPGADTDSSQGFDIGARLQSFILDHINEPTTRRFNVVFYKSPVHNDLMTTADVQDTYDRIAAQVAEIKAAGALVIGTTEFGTFVDNWYVPDPVPRADILAVNTLIRDNAATLFDAFVDFGLLFPTARPNPHLNDAEAEEAAGYVVDEWIAMMAPPGGASLLTAQSRSPAFDGFGMGFGHRIGV